MSTSTLSFHSPNESNRKERRIVLKALAVSLLVSILYGCNLINNIQVTSPNLKVIPAQEVPQIIKAIPSYTRFAYSGLSFFDGKLYASSNIGLLEYENGTLSRLYKWYDNDDVISGPWFDRANQLLWVFHNRTDKLIRFDGKNWSLMDLPRPKEGYSRGDMLRGFQGISTDTAFWLQGGNYAWRWDTNKVAWVDEPIPDTGVFVSIAPVKDNVLVVMRHQYVPYLVESPYNRPDKPESDIVYFMQNKQWQELPNKSEVKFFTEKIVIAKEAAFILTDKGLLLRLSTLEITPIETLGEVEAMTVTSSGNLLVSFRNNGIYEYSDKWYKKFKSPYQPDEADHWTYVSEYKGQVALAITSKPQMAKDNQWKFPVQTKLWIGDRNELKVIPLAKQ